MSKGLKFNRIAFDFDKHQALARQDLAQAVLTLYESGSAIITKSDLVIELMHNDKLYDIHDLSRQDELLGDVSITIGGINWSPQNESLGMLVPSLNPASSCAMSFNALYYKPTSRNGKVSWLLDIYMSQFKGGLLRASVPRWDLLFYSASTYWLGRSTRKDSGSVESHGKIVKKQPFFTMYRVRASLNSSLSYSYSSDSPQTSSVTFFSEDVLLDITQMF